jgi:nitrogen fixation/metabolism regulation signal transduction histidine kinase
MVSVFAFALAMGGTMAWSRSKRREERRRSDYVSRFAAWQAAARRHAHEIKTPLTAARLEVDRLVSLTREDAPREEVQRAGDSVFEELDRLARFTREFSSFAAVAQPVLKNGELNQLVAEFRTTFANAWPGVALHFDAASPVVVAVDRDMLRQVLVNLCTNSARAGAASVTFAVARERQFAFVDVTDDGGGIAESILPRIFDPYMTTRKVGEGMGLGLAISRKIMLDHGGDLTLASSSPAGTTFRLTIVRA